MEDSAHPFHQLRERMPESVEFFVVRKGHRGGRKAPKPSAGNQAGMPILHLSVNVDGQNAPLLKILEELIQIEHSLHHPFALGESA